MNLAEYPIALVADRVSDGQKTLTFEDSRGRLTITGSDAYGLPTALDNDVIVALMYLTKQRNNFADVKVNFSRYELLKLLHWPDVGGSYKRLDQAFNRWTGVMLVYDKCWWDNRAKKYVSAKMHILDNVLLSESSGQGNRRQGDLPLSTFSWNRIFIESCQADNLRQLDLDLYFSLKSAVSKRLYRFLGKRFYHQAECTFDLHELAFDRVGISRKCEHNAGKIKEKLQPAIEELESIKFLQPKSREDRYSRIGRGHWTINLARSLPQVRDQPASNFTGEPVESAWVAELIGRGVTAKTASDLVKLHPEGAIAAKIEVFDWLVSKQDKRVAQSPAGYLVKSITDGYAAPKGFVSAADREKAEEARQAKAKEAREKKRREQEAEALDKRRRAEASAYWDALTAKEQAELQAKADGLADPKDLALESGPLKRMGQQIRREAYIRKLLDEERSIVQT